MTKYVVVYGLCGYLPDGHMEASTLEEVRSAIAFLRETQATFDVNAIDTPAWKIRASNIKAGGVCYYDDRNEYIEVYPAEN